MGEKVEKKGSVKKSYFVVAFSGGKDSTAMVLRLHELGVKFSLLHTPTGNELPEVAEHIERILRFTGAPVIIPPGPCLAELIDHFHGLPNWRQRWCTRMIKIQPCLAWLKRNPTAILLVGIRADEPSRGALYSKKVQTEFPLRDWGWGLEDVLTYLEGMGVEVPARTDCAVCPYQRISDWYALWRNFPEQYALGERWEAETGYTFRSAQRDTWPAGLKQMREQFEGGRRPRKTHRPRTRMCRVCKL